MTWLPEPRLWWRGAPSKGKVALEMYEMICIAHRILLSLVLFLFVFSFCFVCFYALSIVSSSALTEFWDGEYFRRYVKLHYISVYLVKINCKILRPTGIYQRIVLIAGLKFPNAMRHTTAKLTRYRHRQILTKNKYDKSVLWTIVWHTYAKWIPYKYQKYSWNVHIGLCDNRKKVSIVTYRC